MPYEYTKGYRFPFDRDTVDVDALRKVARDVDKFATLTRDLVIDGRIWGALNNVKVVEFDDIGHDSVTSWYVPLGKRKPQSGRVIGFSPTRSIDDMLAFCADVTDEGTAIAALEAAASGHLKGPLSTFPRRLFLGVIDAVIERLDPTPAAAPGP